MYFLTITITLSLTGSFTTALSHAHWALGWSGVINFRGCIALMLILKSTWYIEQLPWLLSTASLHISWVLRYSETFYSSHGSMRTASLHISEVFKSSRTSVKKLGLMYTNHFHGTYFNITLIFILSSLGWVKFYGPSLS